MKHVVQVAEVITVEPATKLDEKGEWIAKKQNDGTPVFALLCKFKAKQRLGLKELDIEEVGKLDSSIEIKPGTKNLALECEQYVMSARNGGRPSLHYRAVKIFDPFK